MKKTIITGLLLAFSLVTFAQNSSEMKFGHINKQELLTAMPEANAAMKTLEELLQKYKTESKKLEDEFTKKQQEYTAAQDTLDPTIKKYKESELQRLYQSIQDFSKNADETLKKKQAELLAPIDAKINNAIKAVGDANGFMYIFDVTNSGTFAYMSSKSIDVLPLVKKNLGLQ